MKRSEIDLFSIDELIFRRDPEVLDMVYKKWIGRCMVCEKNNLGATLS